MTKIQTEQEYNAICERIEELLPKTWGDDVKDDDPACLELNLLANLVADWEDEHVTFDDTLGNAIRKSLFDMSLTQKAGAELLGISPSRMSDLVHGRMEPSYRLSRALCKKLNIPPEVVLAL